MKHILLISMLTALPGQANEMPLSVRTLAVEDGDMPVWFVASKGKTYEPLQWSGRQASIPVSAQADHELALYSREEKQNGEPEFRLSRKVAVPEAADAVLLLGWPVENGKQFEVIAIADDYKKANFNDWLVINRSDQAVTLRYSKESDLIHLEPGETKSYRIKGERDQGGEVIAEAMVNGEMRKFYSTYWAAPSKQRSLVLFHSNGDRAYLRRVIDFLEVDASEVESEKD